MDPSPREIVNYLVRLFLMRFAELRAALNRAKMRSSSIQIVKPLPSSSEADKYPTPNIPSR
jgi:hypothetical protein